MAVILVNAVLFFIDVSEANIATIQDPHQLENASKEPEPGSVAAASRLQQILLIRWSPAWLVDLTKVTL